ncbi:hypothetical protein BKA62DRAFT_682267 [Auriculariales sp. MPI-PUGE-AT-0066]|nr:hypothetical protein BKA62DRAFT_682267 [Auriculariales sp. MPI-PUGE-AT-0066]
MTTIPSSQLLWCVVRRGTPAKALEVDGNAAIPSDLSEDQVLVKVDAAALNPLGFKFMAIAPNWFAGRPHVAENDFAGTVIASKSAKHPVGKRVFGYLPLELQKSKKSDQGALAQYVRAGSEHVARVPDHISTIDAAGVALTGETAYQLLVQLAQVEAGQTLFINGGSSVGIACCQIAKALGCTVWASASGANKDLVMQCGADVFLDYTQRPLHEQLKANPPQPKFHAIIDAVGLMDQKIYIHSPAYLQPTGVFVSCMGGPKGSGLAAVREVLGFIWARRPVFLGGVNRRWKSVYTIHREEELLQLAQWMEEGKLKPVVDSVFEYDDVLKAYEKLMGGHAKGKVTIRINPQAS